MKYFDSESENMLKAVMSAIGKDRDSWEDWRCVRVELFGYNTGWKPQSRKDFMQFLSHRLENREGALFLMDNEVVLLCKDASSNYMEHLSYELNHLVQKETGISPYTFCYDVAKEADRLIENYPYSVTTNPPAQKNLDMKPLPKAQGVRMGGNVSEVYQRRVLLVEDDLTTQWIVENALRGTCRLQKVTDPNLALTTYIQSWPDIVLLDLSMPGKDGKQVMNEILETDPGAHIVIFSSQNGLENITTLLERGACGFISKPFNKDKLLHYVQTSPMGH